MWSSKVGEGADKSMYRLECHLMRVMCWYGRRISVVQNGICDEGKVL